MINNYIKILFRQLFSNGLNSLIHIGGLAIGIFAALIILIYVSFERSFDADLSSSDQLYRVNLASYSNDELVEKSARTSPAMGEMFVEEVATVEDFSRVVIMGEVIAGFADQFVREDNIFLTDQQYFDFFDVELAQGDLNQMSEPLKVMISNSTKEKIFGVINPLGKTLEINSTNFDGTVEFEVVGVFDSPFPNRHLRPEILVSYATLHHFIGKEIDQSFDWLNQYSFLKLSPKAKIAETQIAINESLQKHFGETLRSRDSKWDLSLQPVNEIHTKMDYSGEYEKGVDGKNLSYFLWIAAFVLLMVYLNSVNISNARAMTRAKEIGVRKVSGGNRIQIFSQLMFESLIVNFLATGIAAILVLTCGTILNSFLDLGLPSILFHFGPISSYLLAFWIFGTLLSGIYPAFILTSFSPSRALKGTLKFKLKSAFASPLLVTQLVFCLVIIAGVLTVYKQLEFMRDQKLGISLDNKLVFRSPMLFIEGSGNYQEQIRNSIGSLNSIKKIGATNEIPGNEVYWRTDEFQVEGKEKSGAMYTILNVGQGYFDVFGIEFLAGKPFNLSLDQGVEAIINKKALSTFGFKNPEEAIGEKLGYQGSEVPIIGVIDDYRQQGVNVAVDPMVLNYSPDDLNYYVVDIGESDPVKTIAELERVFKKSYSSSPFEYYFLDEHFDKQYKSEKQFVQLFGMASLVALFIAIMGIFGVTNQLILQKNKELSIRKILGATPVQLMNLISGEYLVWLGICFVVGIPFSYYILLGWLENFQIQISLGWWFFSLPALTILLVFIASTFFQTLKSIFVNPSEILKNE